ncbi:hypothetical protein D9M72_611850 [compost metagenome]
MAEIELPQHLGAGRRNHHHSCGKHEIRLLLFLLVRIFGKDLLREMLRRHPFAGFIQFGHLAEAHPRRQWISRKPLDP